MLISFIINKIFNFKVLNNKLSNFANNKEEFINSLNKDANINNRLILNKANVNYKVIKLATFLCYNNIIGKGELYA